MKVSNFRIIDHGAEHAQFFQGHGLWGGEFQACATGAGHTPAEALSDALEQLAGSGWDVSEMDASPDAMELRASKVSVDDWHECASDEERESCEHHWYVSVDVA